MISLLNDTGQAIDKAPIFRDGSNMERRQQMADQAWADIRGRFVETSHQLESFGEPGEQKPLAEAVEAMIEEANKGNADHDIVRLLAKDALKCAESYKDLLTR